MTNAIKDGWHTIQGYRVYVENGFILRGMKLDYNGSLVPAWPYRACRTGGWDNCTGLSVSAFSAGARRGSITLRQYRTEK